MLMQTQNVSNDKVGIYLYQKFVYNCYIAIYDECMEQYYYLQLTIYPDGMMALFRECE